MFYIFFFGSDLMFGRCNLCPRYCGVNRDIGEIGYCKCGKDMIIARYSLHKWEEPCISGTKGSGTIFFSYCNLNCIFCQNYEISSLCKGRKVSVEEFSDICINLQNKGACNINLVTGVMYIPLIVKGIELARKKGLNIPIVYNSSGYESVEGLRLLDGIVDIYLPDFKYFDDKLAFKYSSVNNYKKYACISIDEMYRQVGKCKFDKNGMLLRGVIIRHSMLPNCIEDSKKIISYLYNKYKNNTYYSIMNQYTPIKKMKYKELNRKITKKEYNDLINYSYDVGIRCAYVQDEGTPDESFIPDFNEFNGIK